MNSRYITPWIVGVAGLILISASGCSSKWLQSDGDSEQGIQKGGRGADGGPLRGFQSLAPGQTPDEERLGRGTIVTKGQGSDAAKQRSAEVRREEAAAMAAGLKDVFFGYDSWSIQEDGQQALTHNAAWLKENPKSLLKIEGHCDERGTQDYNIVLGEKRAKASRSFLVEMGVNPKQVGIVSYGKEQPFCLDRNESCYQQNRRGHVLLRAK
jgi:peptidoglycan-associated lipoprotein